MGSGRVVFSGFPDQPRDARRAALAHGRGGERQDVALQLDQPFLGVADPVRKEADGHVVRQDAHLVVDGERAGVGNVPVGRCALSLDGAAFQVAGGIRRRARPGRPVTSRARSPYLALPLGNPSCGGDGLSVSPFEDDLLVNWRIS